MWTRSLLKTNAKAALSHTYWVAFAACLLAGFLGAGASLPSFRVSYSFSQGGGAFYYLPHQFAAVMLLFVLFGLLIGLGLSIFVSAPIQVGCNRLFMENRLGNAPLTSIFSTFRGPYLNVVKVMFLTNLKIFLWALLPVAAAVFLGVFSRWLSLLLFAAIIPAIIKAYQLSMVGFLLAENPYLTAQRAQELSTVMTQGEKWDIFVLGLSFLGWAVLCIFTCGIGALFLAPYIRATQAELYAALRAKAFSLGITDETELSDFIRY